MIPRANILAWQTFMPWPNMQLVEHDLILSKAICTLYQHPHIRENLVFRGGKRYINYFLNAVGGLVKT